MGLTGLIGVLNFIVSNFSLKLRNILHVAVLLLQIADLREQRSFGVFDDPVFENDAEPKIFFGVKVNQ